MSLAITNNTLEENTCMVQNHRFRNRPHVRRKKFMHASLAFLDLFRSYAHLNSISKKPGKWKILNRRCMWVFHSFCICFLATRWKDIACCPLMLYNNTQLVFQCHTYETAISYKWCMALSTWVSMSHLTLLFGGAKYILAAYTDY
jgi:hypothetical protein